MRCGKDIVISVSETKSSQFKVHVCFVLNVSPACFTDTAAVYRNEVDVGKAVTSALEDGTLGSRAEVKITTKLTPKAHTSVAAAQAELRACIERLGLGTPIDTVLVHWPGTGGKPREDEGNAARRLVTWRVLLEAQARGDVVQLGASNYTVAHLAEMEAAGLPLPAVNQVELHPRLPQEALRTWCADRGVVVQAYSPLGCGDLLAAPAITGMAGKHKTPVSAALKRLKLLA